MRLKTLCLLLAFVFFRGLVVAQTYPSALVTVLNNPRTIFLDEYADHFRPKIKTTIYFTDFTEPSWEFCLRLKITGPNGLVISSKPLARPLNPVVVAPGQPYELQGADLAFYFNYNNLDFSGISRAQLEASHRLPEGFYTFCFVAVDYESGKALSHPACASAYLSLNDPPIIISPSNASVVENISFQNILFQWQLSNATGNLNLSQLTYQLNLYEVNNSWSNPITAIINNQALPVWQSNPLTQNSYLYNNIDPPLERGRRYVFTVRAIESSGRSSFKNNGYSMPSWFSFGYNENDTIDVIKPLENFQFALSTPSEFKWKKPRKALPGQMISYTIKLVEVGLNQDPGNAIVNNLPFFQQTYIANTNALIDKTIPVTIWGNVKRMGNYAWQVTAQSGIQHVAKSRVHTFIGPPDIESFIAGGFVMKVTRLTYYDKINQVISGRCKTTLNSAWNGEETEFSFQNIKISSIGNNEWVMLSGSIADKISAPAFTLQPKTIAANKSALFKPDSVYVNTSGLKLSGKVEWTFPHAGTSQQLETISSERCRLTLANSTFYLNNSNAIRLDREYALPLMEPYGFVMKLGSASEFSIYQSKYELNFKGFAQMPGNVLTDLNTPALVSFREAKQLFYIRQTTTRESEAFRLAQNTQFLFRPEKYVIDLSENESPGEFAADTSWKGLYIEEAHLELPKAAEGSGQISLSLAKSFPFVNTLTDTNTAYVNNRGLFLRTTSQFQLADSIRFNSFASKAGYFYAHIGESEIRRSFIRGGILIPVIDTLNAFPYNIDLTDYGFREGYLLNGLANHSFTFNAAGSAEQRIAVTIKRAVFKGRNRLEMDLDMQWPYFQLNLTGIQRFSVWGNNNIGFDVPNGKTALSYQATGKAGNFDITVDYLGCGRSGNAYAFGASAKINMDEEISGETGPPIVNAYSIYKNPLLSGMVVIPLTTTLSTGSTASTVTNTYQSSTSGYTAALGGGMNDALAQLGAESGTASATWNSQTENLHPLVPGSVITQIGTALDIIVKLKPFIKTGDISERDWEVLSRFRTALDNDIIQKSQSTNAKGLLNFVLNKVVDGIVYRLNQPIENISNQAVVKVRAAINGKVVDPINNRIESAIGNVFDRLRQQALGQIDEKYHASVIATFSVVRSSLSTEIKNSVSNSFETNVTSKLTGFIQAGVTAKITGFIRKEVSFAGNELITKGVNANINLDNVLQNGATLFGSIADTVKDVMLNVNGANFVNTAESLVDDAISGIDWEAIAARITQELIKLGVSNVIASQLSQTFVQNAGPYAGAVLNSVKFDFSNLGEKLQNGQFDQIVKFDPTNIYIKSPAVEIRGTVRFKKDDPVYGDNWQANVFVKVLVPKKDNPVECSGFYLNGKTTQLAENFSFWFVQLDVHGLNIPLNPAPVIWDGAEGFAYSKMKKTGTTSVIPDKTNKFGVGCRFFFYDQQTSGKTYIFDLGADASFNDGGFAIQLSGNASVMNYQQTNGKYREPGFVTGTGTLGYYKSPEVTKVMGNFNVQLNTQPILCAGGDVGLDLKSPSDWKVWVGTELNPISVKVLCKDFLSNTAYLQVGNTGFAAGLGMNVNLSAKSPWVQFTGIKVRGFASLAFGYNAYASIEWNPAFKINEASISAWLSASIGVDYETAASSSSLTLAGVSLSGTLTYKSNPESELHGNMSGSITLIGFNVGLDLPVHYSLSQQKILN